MQHVFRTLADVQACALEQFEIRLTDQQAAKLLRLFRSVESRQRRLPAWGCLDQRATTSVGFVVWLKSRIKERLPDLVACGRSQESEPIPFDYLCPVARSGISHTSQLIAPIDAVAARVVESE